MALKLKSVQMLPGVHIPGFSSQTLIASATMTLELAAESGLVLVDTGKAEHLLPLTVVARLDPISEKYAAKPAPKHAPAPEPVVPAGPDIVKFVKDPKTGAVVEKRG